MNDTLLWTLLGHLVCIAQWAAFILVDYAYLGKNKKVRYPCIWAAVLAACVLFVSIRWDLGFFNTASIATNVVYLLLASLLFGGTPNQKLTGSLISLFGARAFSGWAAGQVFERFLAGSFRDQIAANIAAGGAVSLDGIAQRYAGFLPEAFRASIVDACERSISAVLNDNAVVLADTIVQKVLAPLLTPVISLVLFFVAFALLRMLVSLLVTVLGLVNKLPVIGAVNHWLGWGVGGIASLVDIYLVLCVVWALIVITGGNLTMLNDTVMSGSLYYKVFNVFNPFV